MKPMSLMRKIELSEEAKGNLAMFMLGLLFLLSALSAIGMALLGLPLLTALFSIPTIVTAITLKRVATIELLWRQMDDDSNASTPDNFSNPKS